MKVEGTSHQSGIYTSSEPVTQSTPTQVESIPEEKIRTSGVEIADYTKQHLGYQPTAQEKLIIESIEIANKKILGPQKEFEFAIHKETKQIMVKVIDKESKEVIREIPPEKVLDAVAHMCELAGIFMDEKR